MSKLLAATLLIGMTSLLAAMLYLSNAVAQSSSSHDIDQGFSVYKKANCMGCHKWHGGGGGGYGGDALSLRKTSLTREQIIETVSCGRPGTGMPFHLRGAYDAMKCYGLTRADAADQMPPEAAAYLRQSDIDAVAAYVTERLKGRGEPSQEECLAFFGAATRACDVYKNSRGGAGATPASTN
jgi:mono/diheme cytochrome c family protein